MILKVRAFVIWVSHLVFLILSCVYVLSDFVWFSSVAKSLQSCPTLCDPIDGSPPGSSVPGILQARTLQWVAISFSHAWKWSHSVMSNSLQPHGLQPTRLLHSWDFPGKSTGVVCHCLLHHILDTILFLSISYIWYKKYNLSVPLSFTL